LEGARYGKLLNGKEVVVGFIGIGPMGGKMSRWLLAEGYDMIIYDIDQEKLDQIRAEGAASRKATPIL
jgi:3-hydroxyisobutyrate dehydrogenase-like beta-hydroxyacid dehydrogenase